jgi:low temperature requirement protein LtrA
VTEKERTVAAGRIQLVGESSAVSRLELFLDLIFVFAFIAVSDLAAADLTVDNLLHGVVLLVLLWSCWLSYAWLGNIVRVDRGVMPVVIFGLAAVILVVGVTLQEAFADKPGGLRGPLLLVVCYLVVRCGALLVATAAVWRDPTGRRGYLRVWAPLLAAAPLLLAAGLLPVEAFGDDHEARQRARFALMLAAFVVDYLTRAIIGVNWWRVRSVKHWTERFHLIILVAFGEIIISAGTGQGVGWASPVTWEVVGGAVLSMLLVGVLWWTYFDIARFSAEDALEQVSGPAQARLARDAYTFLHLPMIVGLILLSVGLKHTFNSVAFESARSESGIGLFALYGGVALYLIALIAFERRTIGIWGRGPLVGLVLVLALAPVAARTPVVAQTGLLAAAVASLVLLDRTVFRVRHQALHRAIEPVTERSTGVTPKELFLDLVFVYAFIQVTELMTVQPGWRGLSQGLGVLVLLWWAWCCYAWLGSSFRTESALARLLLLSAAACILVIAVAVPVVFIDLPGGLPGPMVFVTCYGLVRALNFAAFWLVARKERRFRGQLVRLAVPAALALTLLYAAAAVPPPADDPQAFQAFRAALWAAAVIVDLGSGYLLNARHWPVRSADLRARGRRHRAEPGRGGDALVGVLRRRRHRGTARRPEPAGRPAQPAGARGVHVHAPADDRRGGAGRARAAQHGGGGRAGRRTRREVGHVAPHPLRRGDRLPARRQGLLVADPAPRPSPPRRRDRGAGRADGAHHHGVPARGAGRPRRCPERVRAGRGRQQPPTAARRARPAGPGVVRAAPALTRRCDHPPTTPGRPTGNGRRDLRKKVRDDSAPPVRTGPQECRKALIRYAGNGNSAPSSSSQRYGGRPHG